MKRILKLLPIALSIACATASMAQHAKITASQAQKVALARYKGTVVGKVLLENEDGKWQYSVNVRSGKTLREIMVDARSAKIASVEVTSAKEEAAETKAEKSKKTGTQAHRKR